MTTIIPILQPIMLNHLNVVKFDKVCETLCEFIGYTDPTESSKTSFVDYLKFVFKAYNTLTLSNYREIITHICNIVYGIHGDLFTSEKDCYNYLFSEFLSVWETPSTIIYKSPLPSPPPLKRAKPDSKAWIEQHDCVLCGGNNHPNTILICDKCDEGSHLKCLWLEDVPDTKYWFCDFCTSLK